MTTQDLRFASFRQRCIARLIDVTIVSLFAWLIASATTDKTTSGDYYYNDIRGAQSAYSLIFFYFIYYPILEATGGTLGKRLFFIQSVSSDTLNTISFGKSYKRSLFLSWPIFIMIIIFVVSSFSGFYPDKTTIFLAVMVAFFGIIGPLAVLWSKKKQGWHDVWTKTYVIAV